MRTILNTLFQHVVAFQFYDGAETGIAVYESGEAIRFSSLGDSESRRLRAYGLSLVEGHWTQRVCEVFEMEKKSCSERFLLLSQDHDSSLALERDLANARSIAVYVGIGTPYLEALEAASVTLAELSACQRLADAATAFTEVAKIIGTTRD